MSSCPALSNGLPMGRPKRCAVSSTRGSDIILIRVSNDLTATTTVAMPDDSSSLAICPTDIWQTGQTGTRTAACTPSCLNFSTHPGRVFLSSRFWEQAPTKE